MEESKSIETLQAPVLIVGCGPSGMTMAMGLSQFGIESILIDRRDGISDSPRAHALNCRTLEIFSDLGVDVSALRELATPDEESAWVRWIDTLSGDEFGALPYERIAEPETVPTQHPLFNIAQPDVEAVLFEQVSGDPNITIRRGWNWQDCRQEADAVTSVIDTGQGGRVAIESRFLIAADGANSAVRRSLDIPMEGPGLTQQFKNVHFRADLSDIVRHKPAILYWVLKQECSGTLIAYDIRDNWTFMFPFDPASEEAATLSDSVCLQRAKDAIGRQDLEIEVKSVRDWEMTCEVATSYRNQNAFLVGDAAHRYPPSGGLGLNTGVGDAHNLAWKIAGSLLGWAPDDLLDSYDRERRPVATHNANFSMDNAVKMMDLFNKAGVFAEPGTQSSLAELRGDETQWADLQSSIEDQRVHFDGLAFHLGAHYGRSESPDPVQEEVQWPQVGARLPHVWLHREGKRVSSHELICPRAFTLILAPGQSIEASSFSVPTRVVSSLTDYEADSEALQALGLSTGSLLVRPDGHIAAIIPGQQAARAEEVASTVDHLIRTGIAA